MIAVEGVHKRFGTNHVLKGIGLQVPEGGVTALIGPSGSGKSTLLRCVNLLEVPEAGRIRIGDSDLHFSTTTKVSTRAMLGLRRKTGMVFQSFQLFPHRTAVENVMEGLVTVQGWTSDRARDRAVELLDKVGMSAKADAWPSTLSGGQQQRVAIARALAQSPDVLLCDEPTSALDPQLASEVVDVLLQLARDGTTMVMATHDLRLAAAIATNVVFLDSGEIAEAAPSEQFFSDPQDPRTRRFIYR